MFIGLQNPFTIDISYRSLYLYTDISTNPSIHYSYISYINLMMSCVYQKNTVAMALFQPWKSTVAGAMCQNLSRRNQRKLNICVVI